MLQSLGSQRVRHDLVAEQEHHPSCPAGPNVGQGRRRMGGQWMRGLDGITDSMDMSLC